jgi:hypothetical protein
MPTPPPPRPPAFRGQGRGNIVQDIKVKFKSTIYQFPGFQICKVPQVPLAPVLELELFAKLGVPALVLKVGLVRKLVKDDLGPGDAFFAVFLDRKCSKRRGRFKNWIEFIAIYKMNNKPTSWFQPVEYVS